MLKQQKVLKNGRVSQEEIEDIVSTALQSLKTLMVDYETPIEIRLQVALKIFEIFGTSELVNSKEDCVKRVIEKNAHGIETNANRLSHVETLLELISQQKSHFNFHQETLSSGKVRIIPHSDEK
ncbi:MAG: hypothetical protein DRQ49_00500 [Gammaproteobacteria bacterium]|nr:MAG: hypothetical protein DRQ49_00500 [Gammaproteobacteria bacterium]RKZ71882.1 MAG: hypothetical protein DRQ57_18110 [Gammaproteobacteria bacterium]